MKRYAVFAVLLFAAAWTIAAEAAKPDSRSADEKAIRQLAAKYQAAFNEQDAEKLAACWTEDGSHVDLQGNEIQGREAIQAAYAKFFATSSAPTTLKVHPVGIRFVSETVALLDGRPELTPPRPGQPGTPRTAIVLVKEDGQWLIDSARDTITYVPSAYKYLKDLEWLVGDWVDAPGTSDDIVVESTCDWIMNRNYLIRTFTADLPTRSDLSGTQVIGWDARDKVIRSWAFDSSGGFAQGTWHRKGNHWTVKTTGVLPDGSTVSATNTLKPIDDDSFTFRSRNRKRDGVSEPDIPEILIHRRPPAEHPAVLPKAPAKAPADKPAKRPANTPDKKPAKPPAQAAPEAPPAPPAP